MHEKRTIMLVALERGQAVNGFLDHVERAALRDVAHLLPAKWRRIV
jgi:hypothetical protein